MGVRVQRRACSAQGAANPRGNAGALHPPRTEIWENCCLPTFEKQHPSSFPHRSGRFLSQAFSLAAAFAWPRPSSSPVAFAFGSPPPCPSCPCRPSPPSPRSAPTACSRLSASGSTSSGRVRVDLVHLNVRPVAPGHHLDRRAMLQVLAQFLHGAAADPRPPRPAALAAQSSSTARFSRGSRPVDLGRLA